MSSSVIMSLSGSHHLGITVVIMALGPEQTLSRYAGINNVKSP
jgi:hypothetical protein